MDKLKYELNPNSKNHDFINTRGGSFHQTVSLKSAGRSILRDIGNNRGFRPVLKGDSKWMNLGMSWIQKTEKYQLKVADSWFRVELLLFVLIIKKVIASVM